jgi:pimeloyl-ACP methyl ester carboxylesterase
MTSRLPRLRLALSLASALIAATSSGQTPPAMRELHITSHGSRMNGLIYLAGGNGLHPIVVFLHGFPGNERNLDLAQAVRRAGYNALFFDYRGNWGSGGTFSFANTLEDVKTVIAWARSPENAKKYNIDASRIAIVGHSMGGWLTLMSGGAEPSSVCLGALAAWNIGWEGGRFATHPDQRTTNFEDFVNYTAGGGPIHGDAAAMLAEMSDNAQRWNYLAQAHSLRNHSLFLASATRDSPGEDPAMYAELGRALRAAGAKHVTAVVYDDDHPFSSNRVELADALLRWLKSDCAGTQRL